MATAVQGRNQRTLEVVLAAAPPEGWPDPDKYTTPAVIMLPRVGPWVIKVVSGDANIETSFSSTQDILDAAATWEEWPHGAVSGPYAADVLAQGQAIRITATADAVVELMGI